MARKRNKHNKSKSMTIPVSVVAGFGVPVARLVYDYSRSRDLNVTSRQLGQFFTGFDWTTGAFNFAQLRYGLLPILGGLVVHKVAGRLGINRALASAGIPFIRV